MCYGLITVAFKALSGQHARLIVRCKVWETHVVSNIKINIPAAPVAPRALGSAVLWSEHFLEMNSITCCITNNCDSSGNLIDNCVCVR